MQGCPSQCERHPERQRARRPRGDPSHVEPPLAVQERDLEEREVHQSEQNYEHLRRLGQSGTVAQQQGPYAGDAGLHGGKHESEAEHEQTARCEHARAQRHTNTSVFHHPRGAGDVRHVPRHQGKTARRRERDHAGQDGEGVRAHPSHVLSVRSQMPTRHPLVGDPCRTSGSARVRRIPLPGASGMCRQRPQVPSLRSSEDEACR